MMNTNMLYQLADLLKDAADKRIENVQLKEKIKQLEKRNEELDETDVYEETDPTEKLVDDSIEFGKNVMRKKISEYLLKYLPMTPDDKKLFVEEMNKNIK